MGQMRGDRAFRHGDELELAIPGRVAKLHALLGAALAAFDAEYPGNGHAPNPEQCFQKAAPVGGSDASRKRVELPIVHGVNLRT